MRVDIDGDIPDVARDLQIAEREAREALRAAGERAKRAIQQAAPKGSTRRLSSRIGVRVTDTPTGARVTVKPNERYAHLVDQGSGLYGNRYSTFITPKKPMSPRNPKKAATLRFGGPGGVIFRRRVRGQRPQNFIRRAKADAEAEAVRILERGADEAMRKMGR